MRILRVIASADPRHGGPIEGVLRSSAVLARDGHTNEIATLDKPSDPWIGKLPLRVHAVGHLVRRYGYSPRFTRWIADNASRYDAVVLHGIWNYSSVGAWRALRRSPVPYFVYVHGMLDPWFRDRPLKGLANRAYWWAVEGRVLADARCVLFTCQEECRLARTAYNGYGYKERVVAYGTEAPPPEAAAQREAFLRAVPKAEGRRLLLFLGRIHPKKGCDILIDAFAGIAAREPDLDLVIAGPDQTGWRAELERRARARGIDGRIHWPGMLTGDAKWGAFRSAEAFVLPSHQENFGIVVAEAMACGLPVLISDKVNIWKEVQDAGAGLVGSDDAAGFSRVLDAFLALEPDARLRMSEAGRRCFRERFRIEEAAHDLLAAIRENSEPGHVRH